MSLFQFIKSKTFLKQLLFAFIGLILFVFGVMKWLNISSNHDQKIEVPGLEKMSLQDVERTLEDLGAEVVERIRFGDHHSYSKKEIMEIFTVASEKNVDKIIMTEKDAVSIKDEMINKISMEKIPCEVLGIEIEIIDSQEKFEGVIEKLEV